MYEKSHFVITSGASLIMAAIMTLMVNLRHLFYSIAMVDKYRDAGRIKPYLIFSLTDETFLLYARRSFIISWTKKNITFM